MSLSNLENIYTELKKSSNPYDIIFDFKEELLSSDHLDYLEFHYNAIKDNDIDIKLRSTIKSFFSAEVLNKRNIDIVGEFLYNKYKNENSDLKMKADLIQILGTIKSKYAREVALENIDIRKGDLRYRSIIVMGWVGTSKDIEVLNDRLLNDPDGQLRCYAATAMRQIWFNHPKTKDTILSCLKSAIEKEIDEKALEGIIITSQELVKKKLGLKESKYGDVSGDIALAKIKTISALEKY